MLVKDYIKSIEDDPTQVMLINTETGEVWGVDKGALRDRGYPDGGWVLLENVDKDELIVLIYKARGIEEFEG